MELTELRNPKVVLSLVTGTIGCGAIFALYSYITSAIESADAGRGLVLSLIFALYGAGARGVVVATLAATSLLSLCINVLSDCRTS